MIGYYDQEHTSLSFHKTIFQEISDTYPQMNNTEIRNACALFNLKVMMSLKQLMFYLVENVDVSF